MESRISIWIFRMEPGSEFGAIVPSDTLSFVGCILVRQVVNLD